MRCFLILVIFGLTASNYMLLFNKNYHSVLLHALAKVAPAELMTRSIFQVQSRLEQENLVQKQKHKTRVAKLSSISGRIVRRVKRTAIINSSPLLVKAIPAIGFLTDVAVTADDVRSSCENISDISEFLHEFDVSLPNDDLAFCKALGYEF